MFTKNSTFISLGKLTGTVFAFSLITTISLWAQPFAGGDGTEADPYQVATAAQLDSVRFFNRSNFVQTADINLSTFNNGGGWVPISSFRGTYDGGGFTISGLEVNIPENDAQGLFGVINRATVTNLILNNPLVVIRSQAGALAGATFNSTVSGITLTNGTISSAESMAGGLIGTSSNTTYTDIQITGASISANGNSVGALVGSHSGGSITRVRVSGGQPSGSEDVGGIAGSLSNATLSESYAIGGSVTGSSLDVGGLVGDLNGTISNSYAQTKVISSSVSSNPGIGGLAGISFGGIIENSYSASVVTGNAAAGLVGDLINGSITNSYFNNDSTANGNGNGAGLTTAQMRQRASFTGWDFLTTWAIDEGNRFPDFQERQSDELVISGDEGWRMLASPFSARSLGLVLSPLWTQGFTGADTTAGSPNLYIWNEASRTWTLPGDTSFTPGSGTGFLMYVYSDDDNDGVVEGFPKRISQSGSPFSGQRAIDLSFTSTGNISDDGWNLVGNPYPTSIDWNAGNGWTRNNMDETFYVWSDSAGNGTGAYLSWNTLGLGTKGNGKIAPWQGFWVKANAASPRITFSDSVRNSGGVLLKQTRKEIPQLSLQLKGNDLSSRSVVLFHELAEVGRDPLDAYKLHSLNQDYLLLGTSVDGQQAMDIQALPFSVGSSEIELIIEGSNLNGEFTLSWSPEHLAQGWNAELIDTKTGEQFPLLDAGSYTFSLSEAKAKKDNEETNNEIGRPASPGTPVIKSNAGHSRFVIRLSLAVVNGTDPALPQRVELQQNYPNPFNPATTISYSLPKQSRVRLELFDLMGRKVATLIDGRVEAGYQQVRFDARNLASGMYIYRLQAGNTTITKKLTLIK